MKTTLFLFSTCTSQLCPEEVNKKICLDGCAQELLACLSQCDDEECAGLCSRAEIECSNDCPCEENCPFGCPCKGWCEEKLPSGVQQNISLETLRTLGYEPYYQQLFGISPSDEDMTPSSGDYLFIGCKEISSDAFNTGIFGAKEFLLEIQEFENSPSMISKATEHNDFYYYNTNSLSYCGPNKIFGFSPIENIYPYCADYYDCKYET